MGNCETWCLVLAGGYAVLAMVLIAINASHWRKLAEMERIALDLAEENARLKAEVQREVSLP